MDLAFTTINAATKVPSLAGLCNQPIPTARSASRGKVTDTPQVRSNHARTTYTNNRDTHSCARFCPCKGHRYVRIRSPKQLQNAIGTFYLEFTGTCDDDLCQRKLQSLLKVTYFFPQWLLLRMVSATLWAIDLQSCNLALKTPRVVPESAAVFEYARSGNIYGLKSLFKKGLASVHDVGEFTGAPPITASSGDTSQLRS